jgi:hypothetical protein
LQVITNTAAAASLAKVVAANAAKNARPAARGAAASGNRGGQARSSNRNRAGKFAGGRNQQARWRRESASASASYITPVAAAAAAAVAVPNAPQATNSTATAPTNTAAAAPGNSTSAHQKPISPKTRIPRMSCFTSMPRASNSTKAVSVMQRKYRQTSGGIEMCGRYQLRCSETRNAACTDAEIKSGAWVWEYKPLSAAVCSEMKAIAKMGADSGFKNVMCCRSSGCNEPDRAVDKATKVLQRPLRASRSRRGGRARAAQGAGAAPAAAVSAPISNSTMSGA